MTLLQVIESLLFASSRPLTASDIRTALNAAVEFAEEQSLTTEFVGLKDNQISKSLLELKNNYEETNRAFQLVETAAGWQLNTSPIFAPWVRQLSSSSDHKSARLSPAALETLALIAYRQPIIRADIEAVRGVDAGGVLQTILDRGLIKIIGRAVDVPGRPLKYGTTDFFLEHFGIKNLNELPNIEELRNVPLTPTRSKPTESASEESTEIVSTESTESTESAESAVAETSETSHKEELITAS